MNKISLLLMCALSCALMAGCHGKQAKKTAQTPQEKVVQVQRKPSVTPMFYSGAIKPSKVNTITSPVDGVVDSVSFSYGQIVHKGQALMKIKSSKLQNEFHQVVSSYLKSKEVFANSKVSFEGTKELYQEKIVARQEFLSEKTRVGDAKMAYLDAKFKLKELIESIPGMSAKLKKIQLDDVQNLDKIFEQRFDEVKLFAKRSGIILFPVKSSGSDGSDRELEVGGEVKKGQSLLSVGDLSSLGVEFDAGEMEINKLKAGQEVKVTTPAIQGMMLKGEIMTVAVQAKSGSGFNQNAKFPIKVKVDHIPQKWQHLIRVGMNVKIEIDLKNKAELSVPLNAVTIQNGKAKVLVQKGKERTWKNIEAGLTTVKDIGVFSGVTPGELVVTH